MLVYHHTTLVYPPYYALSRMRIHHTALRSCISTLRAIALVYHHTTLRWCIHHTALRLCITTLRCSCITILRCSCIHHTALRLCITTLRYACVVLIAPAARVMPPAWLLLIPCTSARSTPCAAGTVSATRLSWPTRSSRNGRPDRRRSQRGRSRAWRGSRRQTTAPAG